MVTVDVLLSTVPSLALKVKVSVPLQSAVGVQVTVDPERLVDPLETSLTIEYVIVSPVSGSVDVSVISTALSSSVYAV